jgi:hypothetical protein
LKIERYRFGRIRIDGTDYTDDVIILRDRVIAPWWRSAGGHLFAPVDLGDVLAASPGVVVLGLGASGAVDVAPATVTGLEAIGARVIAEPTAKAVEDYNRLIDEGADVVAALHLTC